MMAYEESMFNSWLYVSPWRTQIPIQMHNLRVSVSEIDLSLAVSASHRNCVEN